MRFTALLFLLFTLIPAAHADTGNPALHRLFADEWERGMRESPENASYNGDTRFNDRWSDLSLKAITDSEAADRAAMDRLHAIDRKTLSAADQLHYDTFEWLLKKDIERQPFREYLMPMTHQGGVQTADGITELLAFTT
jgi:uncharacterized protein (DUF885 family)